jgi:hypothetical protein
MPIYRDFYGSDGTRTRDLRRDTPVVVPPGWAGIAGTHGESRPSPKGSCGDCQASAGASGDLLRDVRGMGSSPHQATRRRPSRLTSIPCCARTRRRRRVRQRCPRCATSTASMQHCAGGPRSRTLRTATLAGEMLEEISSLLYLPRVARASRRPVSRDDPDRGRRAPRGTKRPAWPARHHLRARGRLCAVKVHGVARTPARASC